MQRRKVCGISPETKCCRVEVQCLRKKVTLSEHKAMHEENFLSIWLREDGKDKKERHMEVDRETQEEVSGMRESEEDKAEKRR